jgi:hypothetical protein
VLGFRVLTRATDTKYGRTRQKWNTNKMRVKEVGMNQITTINHSPGNLYLSLERTQVQIEVKFVEKGRSDLGRKSRNRKSF